jgi:hypothetical protein
MTTPTKDINSYSTGYEDGKKDGFEQGMYNVYGQESYPFNASDDYIEAYKYGYKIGQDNAFEEQHYIFCQSSKNEK